MADYTAQCSSNQYITLLLRTSVASQDVAGNTTTLNWSLHVLKSGASTSATWGNCSYGVTINGNAYSDSGQVRVEAGGDTTILSGSTVIPHNADGTKTISLSASISGKIVGSLSDSEALATIPRASSLSFGSGTMGSPMTLTINAASSSFTHSLTYQFGSASGTILSYVGAGSHSWTPPLSLANQIPNATAGVGTFTLYTWGTGVEIGRTSYSFTLSLPSSVVPTISAVTATEATSGLAAQFGAFVQNKSTLKVAINASGSYSSTIRSYSVSFNGRTYSGNNCTTAAPTSSGTLTLTATVTDSRGRTASRAITVSVLPYAPPAITRLSAFRCDADGNADDNGDYTGISYAYSISSVNSKNTKSAVIQYKRSTGSSWTNLLTNSAYSANTTVYPTTELLSDYQWDIRLTVSDYFGASEMTVTLPSAEVLMDLLASGDGMGIGKTAETADLLDIGWAARIRGNLTVDGNITIGGKSLLNLIYPVGSIYMSVSSTSPQTLFGGTWTRLVDRMLIGAGSYYKVGDTGGETTHRLTANEMPHHTHTIGMQTCGEEASGFGLRNDANGFTGRVYVTGGGTAGTHGTGGGAAHNNMPPYRAVYMWQRTG